jgi:hypothetical protein
VVEVAEVGMGADVANSLLCVCWVWLMLLRQRSSASATARGWTAEREVSSADSLAQSQRTNTWVDAQLVGDEEEDVEDEGAGRGANCGDGADDGMSSRSLSSAQSVCSDVSL